MVAARKECSELALKGSAYFEQQKQQAPTHASFQQASCSGSVLKCALGRILVRNCSILASLIYTFRLKVAEVVSTALPGLPLLGILGKH